MRKFLNQEFLIEILRYLVCGVSVVAVNIILYMLLRYVWSTLAANTVAFLLSVLYAYFTNSLFVFRTRCTWQNFCEFFGMRIGTIIIDNGGMLLLVWLGAHEMLAKCMVNVIIIGLNYIFSKMLIFRKK